MTEIIKIIKSSPIMIIITAFVTLLIFISGYSLVSIVIPIMICEIIPRIYSLNSNTNKEEDPKKNSKDELSENQLITVLCITYISTIVGYVFCNKRDQLFYIVKTSIDFINKHLSLFVNNLFFGISAFFMTYIILFSLSLYYANKFYKTKEKVIIMIMKDNGSWSMYQGDREKFDTSKIGKWMLYFEVDRYKFYDKVCTEVVENNLASSAKHTSIIPLTIKKTGVSCFYVGADDEETHKKIISYFIEKDLIPKKKNGDYSNMSFKLDEQTRAGEYGEKFVATIKLSEFINLHTGEFIK